MSKLRILLPVVSIALWGCGETEGPVRPLGIPEKAGFAGGVDGGSWVSCAKDGNDFFYYNCSVYDEKGEVEGTDLYELKSMYWDKELGRAVYSDIRNIEFSFNNADFHEAITLVNRLVLVRVKK